MGIPNTKAQPQTICHTFIHPPPFAFDCDVKVAEGGIFSHKVEKGCGYCEDNGWRVKSWTATGLERLRKFLENFALQLKKAVENLWNFKINFENV